MIPALPWLLGNYLKTSAQLLMHITVALLYLVTPTLTLPLKGEGTFEIVSW